MKDIWLGGAGSDGGGAETNGSALGEKTPLADSTSCWETSPGGRVPPRAERFAVGGCVCAGKAVPDGAAPGNAGADGAAPGNAGAGGAGPGSGVPDGAGPANPGAAPAKPGADGAGPEYPAGLCC
ncbi:hypothetical protein AB3662_38960 [Sorangium cellulosum]|uniref:hypothetical protein n=1 Tax=Sorangium cellulosum TaxID=56 RepID=UPI003D9A3AC1